MRPLAERSAPSRAGPCAPTFEWAIKMAKDPNRSLGRAGALSHCERSQCDFAPICRQHFVARFFRALASDSVGLTAKTRDERFRLKCDHQAQRAGFMP